MIFEPVAIIHRMDLLRAVKARREQLGLTGEEVDHRVNLTRGHAIKIENGNRPWGKVAFAMTPAMAWVLQAIGLRLILVDEETARSLVGEREIKQGEDAYQPRGGPCAPLRPAAIVSYEWPAAISPLP